MASHYMSRWDRRPWVLLCVALYFLSCGGNGSRERVPASPPAGLGIDPTFDADAAVIKPPPDDPERDTRCFPVPVRHRGGDPIHDWCADTVPPNEWPGYDALVLDKHFDAKTPSGVLWEVKTERYSDHKESFRRVLLSRFVAQALGEFRTATACGHLFVFAVADEELFHALNNHPSLAAVTIQHIPECERHIRAGL